MSGSLIYSPANLHPDPTHDPEEMILKLPRFFVLAALLLFTQAAFAQKAPRSPEDFYNRGLERQAAGDLDGALADFDLALRLNPADAIALSNRGLLRMQQGDLKSAEQDIQMAIRINPTLKASFEKYLQEMKRRK